jgi:hypothetical protein
MEKVSRKAAQQTPYERIKSALLRANKITLDAMGYVETAAIENQLTPDEFSWVSAEADALRMRAETIIRKSVGVLNYDKTDSEEDGSVN